MRRYFLTYACRYVASGDHTYGNMITTQHPVEWLRNEHANADLRPGARRHYTLLWWKELGPGEAAELGDSWGG